MAGIRTSGPGAVRVRPGTRTLNSRSDPAEKSTLIMENTGDRPVQIGSHIHLPDVNTALEFDRRATTGFRLDIPSGTSLRFEPGASRSVPIVAMGGRRSVPGIQIRRTGVAGSQLGTDHGREAGTDHGSEYGSEYGPGYGSGFGSSAGFR
ncbi:MAG: urease subunit beta [Brevibacterium aurantiacum]|nr:urease subunit beta [Brevibacterium aurantiacum]